MFCIVIVIVIVIAITMQDLMDVALFIGWHILPIESGKFFADVIATYLRNFDDFELVVLPLI